MSNVLNDNQNFAITRLFNCSLLVKLWGVVSTVTSFIDAAVGSSDAATLLRTPDVGYRPDFLRRGQYSPLSPKSSEQLSHSPILYETNAFRMLQLFVLAFCKFNYRQQRRAASRWRNMDVVVTVVVVVVVV